MASLLVPNNYIEFLSTSVNSVMRILQVIVVAEISQIHLKTSYSICILLMLLTIDRGNGHPSDGNRSTATIEYKGCNINRLINSTSLTF